MKKISIVSGCFNEEDNIDVLYARIKKTIFELRESYEFEIIFIDNSSVDRSQEILRGIASADQQVKLIFNTRNFGHIRSPYWGIINSFGDAVIYLASDLQDPPEKIKEFIEEWEKGWKVVLAIKEHSETNYIFHYIRRRYYDLLNLISNIEIPKDSTGFGLYDKKVVDVLRGIKDPYPFLRGIIAELGFPIKQVNFLQPKRAGGISKNNIYTLYDIGMLGLISNSLVPIRIATALGFITGGLSLVIGLAYIILKIVFWDNFVMGLAPLIIGIFFLLGLVLIFLGIIGEYIANIQSYVRARPLVIEKERINFK